MYVYICFYININLCACAYIYVCVCVCDDIHIIFIHMGIIRAQDAYIHTFVHSFVFYFIVSYYTHIRTRTYTHTHTHTHTDIKKQPAKLDYMVQYNKEPILICFAHVIQYVYVLMPCSLFVCIDREGERWIHNICVYMYVCMYSACVCMCMCMCMCIVYIYFPLRS